MANTLEKRTFDARPFNIDCHNLLDPNEQVATIVSILADQGSLSFGTPALNPTAITNPDGSIAPPYTVIQIEISGGVIPSYLTQLYCTIRARFTTTLSPDQYEATVLLLLNDQIYGPVY